MIQEIYSKFIKSNLEYNVEADNVKNWSKYFDDITIYNEFPKFLVFINCGNPETSRVLKISSQWPSVTIEK